MSTTPQFHKDKRETKKRCIVVEMEGGVAVVDMERGIMFVVEDLT
jgi:hypothetical protein